MLRPFLGLSLAACATGLTACQGGIGVTDASSYGSTTQNPSSDPTSNSNSNSEPTTAGTSSGGSGGTGDASSSGSSGPTSGSSGAVTSGPTSGPTTSASTGDTTTGGPASCLDVSTRDYGDCDAFLGYAYDGISCRAFAGCDCAPNCEHFFPSALDCATGCAADGGCNEAAIQPAFLAMAPIEIGTYCDEVDACAIQDSDAANWLAALFPGLSCEGAGPCQMGQACAVQFAGMIDASQWEKLCAASLLPNAELYCVVFGP